MTSTDDGGQVAGSEGGQETGPPPLCDLTLTYKNPLHEIEQFRRVRLVFVMESPWADGGTALEVQKSDGTLVIIPVSSILKAEVEEGRYVGQDG